jgi:beta-galactosidase
MLLATTLTTLAQPRQEVILTDGWQFQAEQEGKVQEKWQTVRVPHDWAIAGPFDKKWDLQKVAIEQNGEKEATEKSGRSGALPWIGAGHYRRIFYIPQGCERAELVFDGAMSEPTVCINGQKAGYWAYGYNAFRVDITPFMKPGENQLDVDLLNIEESSRWYPGAGLYRPVKLVMTGKICLDEWGTFIRTLSADQNSAHVAVSSQIQPATITPDLRIMVDIMDAQGKIVGQAESQLSVSGAAELDFNITQPKLWSPESPYLYQVRTRLYDDGKLLDEITNKMGIRTISATKEGGFQLNGITRKIKGVCLHHDLGPLGAAVNKAALIRQIKLMKEMGCDAIRTSHNMPSQMQMDICDSLGMMVMAESFDMWIYPKCKNGYARFFNDWSDRDIENLKHLPIWFTQSENDPLVPPDSSPLPLVNRLRAAGAENVHISLFEKIVDRSGLFKDEKGRPYEYFGHFSWVYVFNDQVTGAQEQSTADPKPSNNGGGTVAPQGFHNLFDWMNAQVLTAPAVPQQQGGRR